MQFSSNDKILPICSGSDECGVFAETLHQFVSLGAIIFYLILSSSLSLSLFALSLTLYFSFRIISAINRIKLKLMGYVFRLFHHQHLQAFILIDESFHCLVRVPCLLHTSMRCCRLTVLCEWNKLQYSCRLQFRIALTLMIWPPHRIASLATSSSLSSNSMSRINLCINIKKRRRNECTNRSDLTDYYARKWQDVHIKAL